MSRRVALRAAETRLARQQFTYRQAVLIEEVSPQGARLGQYSETRDVVFSPQAERSENVVSGPLNTLSRLILTDEDFQDIRDVQPFLFDAEKLWSYETRFKGDETMDGVECYVLQVRPRQVFAGQRLFDGLLWVSRKDYSIVRTQGKAVPEIRSTRSENLFPQFTTIWETVDGNLRFPIHTFADDTLDFRTGPQRIRLTIRYRNYERFSAESTVQFGDPGAPPEHTQALPEF